MRVFEITQEIKRRLGSPESGHEHLKSLLEWIEGQMKPRSLKRQAYQRARYHKLKGKR